MYYNRNADLRFDEPKSLILLEEKYREIIQRFKNNEISEKKCIDLIKEVKKNVYPDIIIHKRGNNNNNLLVIEIKKDNNIIGPDFDFWKLQSFTKSQSQCGLNYKLGLHISFFISKKWVFPELKWFSSGGEINL